MKIGVSVPTFVGEPVDVGPLAQKAEELGFESFWVPEHPIMPVHALPLRPGPDSSVLETYIHMVDPFVALARASALTTTLKLGTAVCLPRAKSPSSGEGDRYIGPVLGRKVSFWDRGRMAEGGDGDHGGEFRSSLEPNP